MASTMEYSFEKTVLVWVDDPATKELVKKVCNSLKLNIWDLNVPEDLLGIPYFFAVIDGEKLTEEILAWLKETIVWEQPKEFAILLTSPTKSKIPATIKKYFISPMDVTTYDWLKTQIFNRYFAIQRHKKTNKSYDKTIFRVVFISKTLLKKGAFVRVDDLCRDFGVTEKTIKRDFALLRSMGEDIVYDRDQKAYHLGSSWIDFAIEEGIKP